MNMNYTDIEQQILSPKNIELAWQEVAKIVDKRGNARAHVSWDNQSLYTSQYNTAEMLEGIARDLRMNNPVRPVLHYKIPKPNSAGHRNIYKFCLPDRIRARAIERVIEPIFEKFYTPHLASYRAGMGHLPVAKATARRHRRHWKQDYVWRVDVKKYVETIPHDGLMAYLKNKVQLSDQVLLWLEKFIVPPIYNSDTGTCSTLPYGVPTGTGLGNHFMNIYLTDIDKLIGTQTCFYRRMGDDLIILDPRKELILALEKQAEQIIIDKKLKFNSSKSCIGKVSKTPFDYVGYQFERGTVGIQPKRAMKAVHRWGVLLAPQELNMNQKRARLQRIYADNNGVMQDWRDFFLNYRYTNNDAQMQEIHGQVLRILSRYLYRSESPRNKEKAKKQVKQWGLPTFLSAYYNFKYQ